MAAPTSHVLRDGVWVTLPADELTVGDVVQLSAGDRVPADGILLWSVSLQADESLLTGESIAVEKLHAQEEKVKAWLSQCPETGSLPEWPAASQRVYMGSIVTRGRGGVLVTGVGMTTQMGQVAGMLGSIEEEPTPLQKRLGELGKYIAIGCLLVCVIVAVAGLLRGEPLLDMLLVGHLPCCSGSTGRAAGDCDNFFGNGGGENIQASCAGEKTSCGRDFRLRQRNLFRQNRNAHRESYDGKSGDYWKRTICFYRKWI